jgi:hypothetical protein
MAELTYEDIQIVRSWIGQTYSESGIYEKYERLQDLDATILEILMDQLQEARSNPSSLSLPGGLSLSFNESIRALERLIDKFKAQGGTDGVAESGGPTSHKRFVRTDWR